MKRYEVGYEDEMIAVYSGSSKEEAISKCKEDMLANNYKPDTDIRKRIMIANEVSS
jgi:hypothetical protein